MFLSATILGKCDNGHPYLIFLRFQNSCFDKLYPYFLVVELIATYMHPHFKLWCLSVLLCNFSFLILYFNFANWGLLMLYLVDCFKCSFVKDSMMFLEFWYSFSAISAKITIFVPPRFTGNDSSFLSMLMDICPSITGIKNFFHILIKRL